MLNVDSTTGKRSDEINIAVVEKVIFLASKSSMRLLLDLEDNVTSLNAWSLVTLAPELDLGAAANTPVNVDMEDLSVHDGLLAVALLALILLLDNLTLAITVGADSLETLDHGAHLAHHGLHTVTITAGTSLNSTLLATMTVALWADNRPLQGQLGDLPAVNILERNLMSVMDGTGLRGSSLVHAAKHAAKTTSKAATAEELRKEILSGHTAAASTSLEAGLAILIVELSLLGVGKDFVGMGDLLELALSSRVVCVLI